jgi:ABC-type glycerol-3-phosphate transport system permease component
MRLFNNKMIQAWLFGCGATLLFSIIVYMMFVMAFPKNAEEEARIKQFQSTWDKRAEYYRKHPHVVDGQ